MRRLSVTGAVLALLGVAVALFASVLPAAGQTPTPATTPEDPGFVAVVKVNGLLDPVMVDFVGGAISAAEDEGAVALVLQINSTGVVVDDVRFARLLEQMSFATVPMAVWVGPSGSRLTGPGAQLVGAADEVGMAPGTNLGDAGAPLTDTLDTTRLAPITDAVVNTQQAEELGVTSFAAPTIGDFVVNLPGVQTREITQGDQTRREPLTTVQFGQVSLVEQLMHTAASPAVAYLLLVVGLSLIIFELFTAGVGVAGVVGAGSFVLSCYGLAVLPVRWWALALIVAAMVAFAIDVQTGVPRFWTGAGVVAFVIGSLFLFDGLSLSWVTLLVGIVGVLLAFIGGMPSMVRTRFSTPTIGREWMIGELGRAVSPVAPDGVVRIREALWRASTNRATPIEELDRVRVVGIDGLVLEVEPEEGGARDYRERRPKGDRTEADRTEGVRAESDEGTADGE